MDYDLRKYSISSLSLHAEIIEIFEYRGYKSDIWKKGYNCFIALHHGRSTQLPYVVMFGSFPHLADDIEILKKYIAQCVDATIYRTENCEHCGRPY